MEEPLEDYEENQHTKTDIHGFARSPANSQSCWGFMIMVLSKEVGKGHSYLLAYSSEI